LNNGVEGDKKKWHGNCLQNRKMVKKRKLNVNRKNGSKIGVQNKILINITRN